MIQPRGLARHEMTLRISLVGAIAGGLWVTTAEAEPPQYHLEISPALSGADSVYPKGMGIAGPMVGLAGSDPFDPLAIPVVWIHGRQVEFEKPTDSLNFLLGVNDSGLVVGASSNLPYVWKGGKAHLLKPAEGLQGGFANDVNLSGLICGSVINDLFGEEYPACWPGPEAEGVQLAGFGSGKAGAAFCVNGQGQIGGVVADAAGNFLGARWEDVDAAPIQIGPIAGAAGSEVADLNEFGDAVGRSTFADNTVEAMLYIDSSGEVLGLGQLGGDYSYAYAVNDQLHAVGTASTGAAVHAFLWNDGVLNDLNDLISTSSEPFEYVSSAVAIDSGGRIAAEVVVDVDGSPRTRMGRLKPLTVSNR